MTDARARRPLVPHPSPRSGARREIERLRDQIRRHDIRYHVLDRPVVSDAAYDALVTRLQRLEARYPSLVTPDSPTQRVAGGIREGFGAVRHRAQMLSLESTTDPGAVRRFDGRLRAALGTPRVLYVLEPKFDGLSIEVVYRDGRLVSASTRGDGESGEDVTANVQTIRAVPQRLRGAARTLPHWLAVRGEVIMRRTHFAALNAGLAQAGRPPFANPRSAAAGSVRQLDPDVTRRRALDVYFYDVLSVRNHGPATGASRLAARMRAWGLPVSPHHRVGTIDDAFEYYDRLLVRRSALGYEIDGIVVKLDDLDARRRLGVTARHPRWALAFKFPPGIAATTLLSVDVQVGRTGVLTPVAVLRPVELGGVTVTRATLHNWRELERKALRIGDTVHVVRAGDVIPEVRGLAQGAPRGRRAPARPRTCPACGASVVRDGPTLRCPNGFACRAQLARAVQHFASRAALDIPGLGPATVNTLIKAGIVRSLADLFVLTDADLRGLEPFGAVSAVKLASAIDAARRVDLDRFLAGLGIPGVGATTARRVAAHARTLDAIRRASVDELAAARGVGRATARRLVTFFRAASTRAMLDALARQGMVVLPIHGPRPRQRPSAG